MKQKVIEYPTERLNELRERKKKLTEIMNALELQLRDVENQRLMLTCRIEEIETLFNYAKNDQAAVEDCMARNSPENKDGVVK